MQRCVLIGFVFCACGTVGGDCPRRICADEGTEPVDGGTVEADVQAMPTALACGNGECEADESCASCREDCCPDCGNGECGSREDDTNCPEDCGCQSLPDACACGIAPFGCSCSPGCLEAGGCCADIETCGIEEKFGTLTEGCGDLVCAADETCASCFQDCGLCSDTCPPPPLIISYTIGDSRPAVEITILARFITKQGAREWQQVGQAADAFGVALAILVPSDAVDVDVWVHYAQANGRNRSSCEGEELFIPVGVLRVTRIGTLLVGSLVSGGAGEPGNCTHRYAVQ